MSLHVKLGGDQPIITLCRLVLQKAYVDPRISKFFDDVEYEQQCTKLSNYFIMGLGGNDNYTADGKGIFEGHRRLREEKGLNDTHFDVIIEIIKESLIELEVPEDLRKELEIVSEGHRDQVLGRSQ